MDTDVIILAGGKGKRMNAEQPKVLNEFVGRTFLDRVLNAVEPICLRPTIIVGYKANEVIRATGNRYRYVLQQEQRGTAHAVMCARKNLEGEHVKTLMVLNGDHPLVTRDTIKKIIKSHQENHMPVTIGSTIVANFEGDFALFADFGRVVRDAGGRVERIVEVKDATDAEKTILEVNLNYYCFQPQWLWNHIDSIKDDNKAGEYYLTDIVKIARWNNDLVNAFVIGNPVEGMGVNSPEQLEIVKKYA